MNIPNEPSTEINRQHVPDRTAAEEPISGAAKKKSGNKSKLFPKKLHVRPGEAGQNDDSSFTGRIQSITVKEAAPGRLHANFSLLSKGEASRTYALKDCETGLERLIFNLVIATLSTKRKVTLKTAKEIGADPRITEIEVRK